MIKPKLLMVETGSKFTDLWLDIYEYFKVVFEVIILKYEDDVRKIEKFDPEYVFYFQNMKSDFHRGLVKKFKKKIITACWVLDDPNGFDETVDVGVIYDIVFTIDFGAFETRKSMGYFNVYYMPPCVNTRIFYPNHTKPELEHVLFISHGKGMDIDLDNKYENLITLAKFNSSFRPHFVEASEMSRSDLAKEINSAYAVIEADQRELIKNSHKAVAKTPFSGLETMSCKKMFLFDNRFHPETMFKPVDDFIAYSGWHDLVHKVGLQNDWNRVIENAHRTIMRKHTIENRMEEIITVLMKRGKHASNNYINL